MTTTTTARQQLVKLREADEATQNQIHEFLQLCQAQKIPKVTIYCFTWSSGWYDMRGAYVFTQRTDAQDHIWYFSPRSGLTVSDLEGKNGIPFEQWDPEADLFTDDSLYDGATNMDPVRRERQRR